MEVELVRPSRGAEYSLGNLLKLKASQGVKVYIMLFGSAGARLAGFKQGTLKIIEDYQHLSNFEIMEHGADWSEIARWSHHEKLVVLDRTTAFVGGIDLTQNRWDNGSFSLFDENAETFDGIDFRNTFLQVDG